MVRQLPDHPVLGGLGDLGRGLHRVHLPDRRRDPPAQDGGLGEVGGAGELPVLGELQRGHRDASKRVEQDHGQRFIDCHFAALAVDSLGNSGF